MGLQGAGSGFVGPQEAFYVLIEVVDAGPIMLEGFVFNDLDDDVIAPYGCT
jgi:hypothetical protein